MQGEYSRRTNPLLAWGSRPGGAPKLDWGFHKPAQIYKDNLGEGGGSLSLLSSSVRLPGANRTPVCQVRVVMISSCDSRSDIATPGKSETSLQVHQKFTSYSPA